MRKFLFIAALATLTSGAAFAQTSSPQGFSNNPNPSPSASSNDRSKDPSGAVRGSEMQSGGTVGSSTSGTMGGTTSRPNRGGEAKDGDDMNKGGMSR